MIAGDSLQLPNTLLGLHINENGCRDYTVTRLYFRCSRGSSGLGKGCWFMTYLLCDILCVFDESTRLELKWDFQI